MSLTLNIATSAEVSQIWVQTCVKEVQDLLPANNSQGAILRLIEKGLELIRYQCYFTYISVVQPTSQSRLSFMVAETKLDRC